MSLAASIQITDQDIYQQYATKQAEAVGQLASTPDGRVFAYANAGGSLTAGQVTQPAAVTANYVTRTLSVGVAAGSNKITVTLGTTAAQDAFVGFYFVVTDGTGKGQGSYRVVGNTAATSGNSNTTTVEIKGAINIALDNTSVVGLYPSQETAVIQHTASLSVPTAGAPVINVTNTYWFWNQVQGYASILQNGTIAKNDMVTPGATTAGSVDAYVTGGITQVIGYVPEAGVSTKYSPTVLTIVGI